LKLTEKGVMILLMDFSPFLRSYKQINIPFSVYDVELYGSIYTEKWILIPGRHYLGYLYSLQPPTLPQSGASVPGLYAERAIKSYSGDVTGIFG